MIITQKLNNGHSANLQSERDRRFMISALNEASFALANGELPVGCVVVVGDQIVATGRNSRHAKRSKIAHAELNAIRSAESLLHEHLGETEIFVTLEPCLMCFGAIICSRFSRVVFGTRDYLAGATISATFNQHYSEFAPKTVGGILADESLDLLKEYIERNGAKAIWAERYFSRKSYQK